VSAPENVRAMVMGGKYVGFSKFVKKSIVMRSLGMDFFISSAKASSYAGDFDCLVSHPYI